MLQLKNIVKRYKTASSTVEALRGVSITFRKNEFVSILGPSGCGKTTLLNIIGGLDRYDSGDLMIGGVSTREYRDRDWDSYRNHSVGFVFQSYNLIPHQTVLANVELALTLSGISRAERRRRAEDALRKVGLEDQMQKRPNMLSGGQMQRVAIARALVNDPEILLADEPTGALDSETSLQVMEIMKEVAKDRLVIMVTHNPDLAEQYSTRIIRLMDGKVIGDTDPCRAEELPAATREIRQGKTHMSFFTALSLSLNNLMTKKARTILVSFAGSIGIIGIALILALSNGVNAYIDTIQSETLGEYPLTIQSETTDITGMMTSIMSFSESAITEEVADGEIASVGVMNAMFKSMLSGMQQNDMTRFRAALEEALQGELADDVAAVTYGYDLTLPIYAADTENGVTQINPSTVMSTMMGPSMSQMYDTMSSYSVGSMTTEVWRELTGDEAASGYTLVAGEWPEEADELLLIVSYDRKVMDFALYTLGLKDQAELTEMMESLMRGEEYEAESPVYRYEDLLGMEFRLVLPTDYYQQDESGAWVNVSEDAAALTELVNGGMTLRIAGIAAAPEGQMGIAGSVGYTEALTNHVIDSINHSPIVTWQTENPETDVFTGLPFATEEPREFTMADVEAYLTSLPEDERAATAGYLSTMTEEEILAMFSAQAAGATSTATYEGNLSLLGTLDPDTPSTISIYAESFESKDEIIAFIRSYNDAARAEGHEEYAIEYTDYVGLLMDSVTTITNAISYVLIAFVSVSLIVSSIMIGVITYISVLERTKEIGILRAMGASKRNISQVFNAETVILGLVSGLIGVGLTAGLCFPINLILENITGVANLSYLPLDAAAILVLISVVLNLIAGVLPSRLAAKRDPVVALRTE